MLHLVELARCWKRLESALSSALSPAASAGSAPVAALVTTQQLPLLSETSSTAPAVSCSRLRIRAQHEARHRAALPWGGFLPNPRRWGEPPPRPLLPRRCPPLAPGHCRQHKGICATHSRSGRASEKRAWPRPKCGGVRARWSAVPARRLKQGRRASGCSASAQMRQPQPPPPSVDAPGCESRRCSSR